jgi:hypothetical protein
MPRKVYTASTGDTLENISRNYFGVPSRTQDIINSNPFLRFRQDSINVDLNGTPLIFDGDIVVVITDPDSTIKTLSGKDAEEVTLYLNGDLTPIPNVAEIALYFDACCDTFGTTFPFDPYNDFDRKRWQPLELPEYEIFIGNEQVTGGKFESAPSIPRANKRAVSASGRTFTLVLEKSNFPDTAYPLEREKENLSQIAKWAFPKFGIEVDDLADNTSIFKKAAVKNSRRKRGGDLSEAQSTAWDYVAMLATKSQRVMHASANGYRIEIVQPTITQPVERFEEGIDGFEAPSFSYNTADLFGGYLGVKESANRPRNMKTFADPYFNETSYKFFSFDDVEDGNVSDALKYEALKSYRDFFTTSFSRPGLLTRDGKLWKPGQIVTLNSPSAMIYSDFNFLIRWVKYIIGPTTKKVELGIIPPEVYMGLPLPKLPFAI